MYKIKITDKECMKYYGKAKQYLANFISEFPNTQHNIVFSYKPTIICKFVIGESIEDSTATIYLVSALGNFFTHPRTGEIAIKTYHIDRLNFTYDYIDNGGTNPAGEALPNNQIAYILDDNDRGTKLFYKGISSDSTWNVNINPEDNYGNIDWIEYIYPNSTVTDKTKTVLTWKGPPSRYWSENVRPEGIHFGMSIYEAGSIKATLPMSPYFSELGEQIPYVVLGAAKQKAADNSFWLVVVGREYYEEISATGALVISSAPVLLAKPFNSIDDSYYNADTNPTGWRVLLDGRVSGYATAISTPIFFNGRGTIAKAITPSIEVTAYIDVKVVEENTYNITGSFTYDIIERVGEKRFTAATTYSTTFDSYAPTACSATPPLIPAGTTHSGGGDSATSGGAISETIKWKVAVDYIGDVPKYAYMSWNLSAIGEVGSHYITRVSSTVNYASRAGSRYNNTGSVGTHRHSGVLTLGSMSIETFKYTLDYFTGSRYKFNGAFIWNLNDGPSPGSTEQTTSGTRQSIESIASAIAYADLRNNTVILIQGHVTSSSDTYTTSIYRVNGVNTTPPINENPFTFSKDYKIIIYRNGSQHILPAWDDRLYLDVTTFFPAYDYPLVPTYTTSAITSATFSFFITTNQPIGSVAFDRYNNYFTSVLYKNGTYNSLNGIDPNTILEVENHTVYFPLGIY